MFRIAILDDGAGAVSPSDANTLPSALATDQVKAKLALVKAQEAVVAAATKDYPPHLKSHVGALLSW